MFFIYSYWGAGFWRCISATKGVLSHCSCATFSSMWRQNFVDTDFFDVLKLAVNTLTSIDADDFP
jgi:hypothetical protein